MTAIMPVLTNGGTYTIVKAHDVLAMAHVAIADIGNRRQEASEEVRRATMNIKHKSIVLLVGAAFMVAAPALARGGGGGGFFHARSIYCRK